MFQQVDRVPVGSKDKRITFNKDRRMTTTLTLQKVIPSEQDTFV